MVAPLWLALALPFVPGSKAEATGLNTYACKEAPSVPGNCNASLQRWSYHHDKQQCLPFTFSGCGGTSNNFDSQGSCEDNCISVPNHCCSPGTFCCGPTCVKDTSNDHMNCLEPTCCENKLPSGPTPPSLHTMPSKSHSMASQCSCKEEQSPVCSHVSTKTYPSECAARCAGDADFLSLGPCETTPVPDLEPCICPIEFKPVCSRDTGTTYGNKCNAECSGDSSNLSPGECTRRPIEEEGCICPQASAPVCSRISRQSYRNLCFAECASDVDDLISGDCSSNSGPQHEGGAAVCSCKDEQDPVCSMDTGRVYKNDCLARCAKDAGNLVDTPCSVFDSRNGALKVAALRGSSGHMTMIQ